jgi:hypothetical protein
MALNVQEGSREQREKSGGMRASNGDFRRAMLKRPWPETAPTLAFRAKKIPTDKGWDFSDWWSWGDLNPRPQTFFEQFYMCSRLIYFSLPTSRSGTLCKTLVTYFLDPP